MRTGLMMFVIFAATLASYCQNMPLADSSAVDQEETYFKTPDHIPKASAGNLRQYQKTKIPLHAIDPKQWEKIAGKTDFSETDDDKPAKPWFNFDPTFLTSIKYLIWALVIGGVCWVLYLILKRMNWDRKLTKSDLQSADITQSIDDINALDLTGMLRAAIEARNYRVAIRIYYLMILHQLDVAGKIIWKKDKTNREYLAELFAKEYFFSEMRHLTIIYEQVWYGEHTVDATSFDRLKAVFEKVQQQIPAA